MVLASHVIFGVHGFWLPNDPRGLWKVYLNSEPDIARAVAYVEENPVKEEKPRQEWSCVTRFQPTGVDQ